MDGLNVTNGAVAERPLASRKRRAGRLPLRRRLPLSVGGVGCFGLSLSLWNCTAPLADLTHSPVALAFLLAVGTD